MKIGKCGLYTIIISIQDMLGRGSPQGGRMKEILEKAFVCFAIIVFVAMLSHHGNIDFTLWDKTVEMTQEAVNSEQGQELIQETKDTAYDTATIFLGKAKEATSSAKQEMQDKIDDSGDKDKHESVLPSGLVKAKLIRVVDGDTIVIKPRKSETETKVRLIGIDTPESVNPDESKNTEYGEYASMYTKTTLQAFDDVYLAFDTEETDQYGRYLCYVWLKDVYDRSNADNVRKYMLNGILVSNGIAIDKAYEPNVAYADMFAMFREDAEANKIGLWQYEDAFS